MPKEQVQNTLRRVKDLFEQKSAFNAGASMSEYNNPGPIENNIFTATHNGQGAITVNAIGGDIDVKGLADLDWWNNKFYSSYGIPKQYFGWTDDGAGFNGGSALTVISSVYAKAVKRVQNALIQLVTDIINLYLINRGYRSYINNFTIKMKAPLTQEEISYRENLSSRVQAISSIQALLSDIEDKPRRLEILKVLINTLDYGDDILQQIQEEIKAVKEQQKAEKEAAEKEAALAEAGGESGSTDSGTGDTADLGDLGDLDLDLDSDNSSTPEPAEAPADTGGAEDIELPPVEATQESFESNNSGTVLVEDAENTLYLSESDDLPTPELLEKDFTQNN